MDTSRFGHGLYAFYSSTLSRDDYFKKGLSDRVEMCNVCVACRMLYFSSYMFFIRTLSAIVADNSQDDDVMSNVCAEVDMCHQ